MEQIQIRKVRLTDAKDLTEINVLCWQKNYRGLLSDDFLNQMEITPNKITHFQNQIKENPFCFCAVQNEKVVGYLNAQKNTNKKISAEYEIKYFYIHPDFQHLRIGTKLLEYFKNKINFQPFYLYMLSGNKQAKKFYEKMGGIQQPKSMDIESEVYHFKIHEVCFLFKPKE